MYIRTVKVPSSNGTINEYVRIVESYRQEGKVKQRTIADLGRKDVLAALLPQLERVLKGLPKVQRASEPVEILEAATWGPVLVVRALFDQLGLWDLFDDRLGVSRSRVPYADRAFVLIANRLIRPKSEHGLAGWLETDFVCDRQGRRFVPHWHRRGRVRVHHEQLDAWYRTLDRLVAAKAQIEARLYERLRDLFHLHPDLVLYDITSTYFEGAGPTGFARHGYSRDGRPQNVQVIVGLVMVAGWPIAHHVWEGNLWSDRVRGRPRHGQRRQPAGLEGSGARLSGRVEAASQRAGGRLAAGDGRGEVGGLPHGDQRPGTRESAPDPRAGSGQRRRGATRLRDRFRRTSGI
jgi:hypothetical protein